MISSIFDIYEKAIPSIKVSNPEDFEYYCFQVKWNPQGTRLLATIQWTPRNGGDRFRSIVTMRPDGSEIRTAITNAQWSKGGHHINWTPDGEHLSMNLNVDGQQGIEIITVKYDGSDLKTVYPVGSGHPSFHPKGLPFIVTDAYSGEISLPDGKTPIRLINIATQTEQNIAEIILPEIKNFEFRVDAHPVWDRSGRYVVFNGTDNGTRCVYVADLNNILKKRK
jgi:Tol biopolymer transport system component